MRGFCWAVESFLADSGFLIADGTFILEGGYRVLSREEVVKILKESL